MKFSLIMSTLGRFDEVIQFIRSLHVINHRDIELIIIDQNDGPRLQLMCEAEKIDFPFFYFRRPDEKGASRGRNAGLEKASGDVICFPDDDCVYPPDLLDNVAKLLESKKVDIVCGRAAAPDGRSINGRFESVAQAVTRDNVFTTQIEWMVFFKRGLFKKIHGFDEQVGVGAATPWQSCEGPDITLRALDAGFTVFYDPAIYAFHPELNIETPNDAMIQKGRRYARGMGYVLRKHSYSFIYFLKYIVRPLGGACLAIAKCNFSKARYYSHVVIGRTEGYGKKCIGL